jgi:serine O-acetyltransferase
MNVLLRRSPQRVAPLRYVERPMPERLSRHMDLERAIDGVVESYAGPEEINNLGTVALPNERAVIEALLHLKPALFMGFYSKRELTTQNLRYAIAEHMYPAAEILVPQIDRAVRYEEELGRSEKRPPGFSERVVLELYAKLPEIRRVLNLDVLAAFEGDPAAYSVEEVIFSYPSIEAISTYRLAHELWNAGVPMIPRIWAEHAHRETGIDIHPGADIGPAIFIDHGSGVVIGETSTIGRGVKLYQGVTLGALSIRRCQLPSGKPVKRHPTLEDDVCVYAGASILGGETVIGARSVIGANQWVTASVEPDTKVFGQAKSPV